MAPKSFRGPGVQHFELVPRSVRDPLYNDPDAPDHVMEEVGPKGNEVRRRHKRKGKEPEFRKNEGQATMYNVFFDDSEYDYMQHLMPIGGGGDPNSVFVPATKEKEEDSGKGKNKEVPYDQVIKDQEQYYFNKGLRPDMDPEIREVLEALEDSDVEEVKPGAKEEDEGVEDMEDYFADVVDGGERGPDEKPGYDAVGNAEAGTHNKIGQDWLDEMAKFKSSNDKNKFDSDDSDLEDDFSDVADDEDRDTIAELTASRQRQQRQLRKGGGSRAGSAFSMSSSAMYRNEGLTTLDERFDKIEAEYATTDEEDEEDFDDDQGEEVRPREDFDQIMDDFLARFQVLGNKAPEHSKESPMDMLNSIRKDLKVDNFDPTLERKSNKKDSKRQVRPRVVDDSPKDRWDCETVLSTYSNTANHPRKLSLRQSLDKEKQYTPRFKIDPRHGVGLSVVDEGKDDDNDNEQDEDQSDHESKRKPAQGRSRKESKEEKRARKEEAKAARQSRRAEKRENKEVFEQAQARGTSAIKNKVPTPNVAVNL